MKRGPVHEGLWGGPGPGPRCLFSELLVPSPHSRGCVPFTSQGLGERQERLFPRWGAGYCAEGPQSSTWLLLCPVLTPDLTDSKWGLQEVQETTKIRQARFEPGSVSLHRKCSSQDLGGSAMGWGGERSFLSGTSILLGGNI